MKQQTPTPITESKEAMKDIFEISDTDAAEVFSIGAGWELFRRLNRHGIIDLKFRKLYNKDDIKFNEDGYIYKSTFIDPNSLTVHIVKELNEKGYSTPYNQLKQ